MMQVQPHLISRPALRLVLPWPPSGNVYWRHVTIGGAARVILSREAKEYRARVARLVLATGRRFGADRLAVRAVYHAPDARGRDLDNFWKQVGDALQKSGLYADDAQIDRLGLERGPLVRPDGQVVVTVEQMG